MQSVAHESLHRESFDRFVAAKLSALVPETLAPASGDPLWLAPQDIEVELPWGEPHEWRIEGRSYSAAIRVAVELCRAGETARLASGVLTLKGLPWLTDQGTFVREGVERVPLAQLREKAGVTLQESIGASGLPVLEAAIRDGGGRRFGFRLVMDGLSQVAGCEVFGDSGLPVSLSGFLEAMGVRETLPGVLEDALAALLGSSGTATDDLPSRPTVGLRLGAADRRAIDGRLASSRRALGLAETADGTDVTADDVLALLALLLASAGAGTLGERIPDAAADDPSDLRLARVWLVGDHLEEAWRRAVPRLRPALDEELASLCRRLASRSAATLTSAWCRPIERRLSGILAAAFDRYLVSSLCPPLDRTNPLSEVSHKRTVTRLGPGALQSREGQAAVRSVHPSHYGRVCLLETPESDAIGLRLHLAMSGGVDDDGNLTSEVVIEDGREPRQLTAQQERELPVSVHPDAQTGCGSPGRVRRGDGIAAIQPGNGHDARPEQALGVAAALVPFIAHDELARAGMGAKNMKQAVPLLTPEVPLVLTGAEAEVVRLFGCSITAAGDGTVQQVTDNSIVVDGRSLSIPVLEPGHLGTAREWRPRVGVGQQVTEGQVLADGPASVDGQLALGANVLVAYLSYDGANFEDGIVVSDRLVRDNVLTSRHVWERTVELAGDEVRLSADDLPESLEQGGSRVGTVRKGQRVSEGSVLVRSLWLGAPGRPPQPREHRLDEPLSGVLRDVRCEQVSPAGDADASRVHERISFLIEDIRPLRVGDKLSGRHGNKGVVTRIVPQSEMPRLSDGTAIDVLLNPHGVVSRMNVGQLLETHWGWAAAQLGCRFAAAPFRRVALAECDQPEIAEAVRAVIERAETDEQALTSMMALAAERGTRRVQSCGIALEKFTLTDPRSGRAFEHPVTVGWQYLMKLNHLAVDKVHGRATGELSRITMQAVKGRRRGGGQRLGEMELWALLAHGVPNVLADALGLRGDDVSAAASVSTVIGRGSYSPALPEAVRVLALLLRGLSIRLEFQRGAEWHDSWAFVDASLTSEAITGLRFSLADARQIEQWSGGFEVNDPADLRRVRQYYCPEHGWWDTSVTLEEAAAASMAALSRRGSREALRQLLEQARNLERTQREERKCPELIMGDRGGQLRCARKPSRTRTVWAFARQGLFATDRLGVTDRPAWREATGFVRLAAGLINPVVARYGRVTRSKELTDIVRWRVVWDCEQGRFVPWSDVEEGRTYCGGWELLQQGLADDTQGPLVDRQTLERLEVSAVPVVPPDFRAIEFIGAGAPRPSDLHRLYKELVEANRELRAIQQQASAPTLSVLKAKRRLQLSLNALMVDGARVRSTGQRVRALGDYLQGKSGILRHALLGKRVNFSGRAVIVGDPSLGIDECRLPRSIAETAARSLGVMTDDLENTVVLLNRAPTLHRSNLLAARARLWDHDAIGLPPLVCGGFNADFDGDTMSVHFPLLPSAQAEAEARMLASRHLVGVGSRRLLLHLTQDIVSGAYLCGMIPESEASNRLRNILDWDGRTPLDRKRLNALIAKLFAQEGSDAAARATEEMMRLAFGRLTCHGLSLSVFDIPTIDFRARQKLMSADGDTGALRRLYFDETTGSGRLVDELRAYNPLALMVLSGARGDTSTVTQLGGARGAVSRVGGSSLPPVMGNFREGLSPLDFLTSSYGARKTLMDKKLATARAGYLTRRLVEATFTEVIRAEDCGATEGIEVREFKPVLALTDPAAASEREVPALAARLLGRVLARGPAGVSVGSPLDEEAAAGVAALASAQGGGGLSVRSPLTCRLESGICQRCYGWDPSTRAYPVIGLSVGVIAGQSIGERGTQLTMQTFHSGGVMKADITSGLPRVLRLLSGFVDMRRLRIPPAGTTVPEWEARWSALGSALEVKRDSTGRALLDVVRLEHYLVDLPLLWHGFHWEMLQVYGGSVDAKHFEVVLRSMCRAARRVSDSGTVKAPALSLTAAIDSGGTTHVLAAAGFESALSVVMRAACDSAVDSLQSLKSRVMLGK